MKIKTKILINYSEKEFTNWLSRNDKGKLVENSDAELIKKAFKTVESVPEDVIKRIVSFQKKNIELACITAINQNRIDKSLAYEVISKYHSIKISHFKTK